MSRILILLSILFLSCSNEDPILCKPSPIDKLNESLILAAQNGNSLLVKHFLTEGADAHAQCDSVLIAATRGNHLETVSALFDSSNYFYYYYDNSREGFNRAFELAVENGNIEMAKMFLNTGLNFYSNSRYVFNVAIHNSDLNMLRLLLDEEPRDYDKVILCLDIALSLSNKKVIEFLLSRIRSLYV